ncbi:MAG: methyltransferase domain-containing protein [Pirellula sp.]|nr:methyltransferase domain-containing protein [Pirellula sp.]
MRERNLVPEWMDDPDLDSEEHHRALAGLRRINWLSGTVGRIASEIDQQMQRRGLDRCRVLDVGCGSGDIACAVARRLAERFAVTLTGWDFSQTAIEQAIANRDRRTKVTSNPCEIHFEVRNALDTTPKSMRGSRPFDFVYCSLFMHHFTEGQALELMTKLSSLTEHVFLIDDLVRSRYGWLLAQVGCRLLSRSRVVHFDGPQSVKAAFTASEIQQVAAVAGLHPVKVRKCWPARMLFTWERTHG